MTNIKNSFLNLDYAHREMLVKSLGQSERRNLLMILKSEKKTFETDRVATAIFEKIKKSENYSINISRTKDRKSIVALINRKLQTALDEIAYFFGYLTAKKTQRLANDYLKISNTSSNELAKPVSSNELIKILIEEKRAQRKGKINLKDVLEKHGYSCVITNCTADKAKIFLRVDLKGVTFENCNFEWCHFISTFMSDVTFSNCNFSNSSFLNAKVDTCTFYNCKLQEVLFIGAKIENSDFSSCSIIGGSFEDASITLTAFLNSRLPATHFLEALIKNCDLINCNLKDTVFFGNFEDFFVDEKSKKTVGVTRPTTAILVNPESRGISTPKAYMKLDQIADTIPLRISLKSQKTKTEKLNIEIKTILSEIGHYDKNKSPIPQQLIKNIAENSDKHPESIKILKKAEKLATEVDAFLLPGGEDVPPALYGQKEEKFTEWGNDYSRSLLELSIIHQSFNKGIPLMGICRGFQMSNIYFGSQLLQHVQGHEGIQKFQLVSNEHKGIYHYALKDSILSAVFHHQAVSKDNSHTEHLEPSVIYEDLIKASELKYSGAVPMTLLQFHPEFFKAETAEDMAHELLEKGLEIFMSKNNEVFWKILSDNAKAYRIKKIALSELVKKSSSIRGLQKYESEFGLLDKRMLPNEIRIRRTAIENLEKQREKILKIFKSKQYTEKNSFLKYIINALVKAHRYLQPPEDSKSDRFSEERAIILAALKDNKEFARQLGTEKQNRLMSIIQEVNPDLYKELNSIAHLKSKAG